MVLFSFNSLYFISQLIPAGSGTFNYHWIILGIWPIKSSTNIKKNSFGKPRRALARRPQSTYKTQTSLLSYSSSGRTIKSGARLVTGDSRAPEHEILFIKKKIILTPDIKLFCCSAKQDLFADLKLLFNRAANVSQWAENLAGLQPGGPSEVRRSLKAWMFN